MSTTSDYRVIGTRPIRHDGVEKVTGQAKYAADIQLTGMLQGEVVRSPHPHARILSIDTSAAERMPGVKAVATAADFPEVDSQLADLGEGDINLAHLVVNVLAQDKALYKGHAVAAVAASTREQAQAAAAAVVVEYEVLPHVLDVLESMQPDAPVLHDGLERHTLSSGETSTANVSQHIEFLKGTPDDAFAGCDIVVEREFKTETVHQGYIEPHSSTAVWNSDGQIKVWTATQGSFACRQQVADLFQTSVSKVTVVPCEIGGGFGGKISVYLEPVAAILSRKSGRPVKLTMSREEVFEASGPTPASAMRLKLGATQDGRLVAGDAWLAYDAGAFPGGVIGPGCMCIFSCYDLEHARVEGFDVVTNRPKTQPYRAPGSTHAAFAIETIVDEICEQLEIDPIDFRLKNAAKEGVQRVDGLVYPRVGLVETLEAIKESEHWNSPLEGPNRGRGIACGFWFNAGLKSSVAATINPDGSVTLVEGSTDIGGTRTSIAMQLAERLGIAAEDVHPLVADTDGIGYTDVTGGSRVTFATGLAACKAADELLVELKNRAARIWSCGVDEVQHDADGFHGPEQSMTWKELCSQIEKTGSPVVAQVSVAPKNPTHAFGVHIADVEVDPETGKTTVLRYTAAQDAGTAIHPSYVEGQMQGGAVQGIGWALNEEYWYPEDGQMRNASFLDYRMPTCFDIPSIDTLIVEVPNPDHPYGVRGVGEVPIVPPPAAIANAMYRATGIRFRHLPMSPPRVWQALEDSSAE